MRRRRLTVCLAAATLALLAAHAGQAAPPQEEPRSSGTNVPATAKKAGGRTLPFSGLDLALLTAGGGPLLLIGVSLRRRQPAPKVAAAKSQGDSLTLA